MRQLDADVCSSARPELVLGVSESKSGARLETFGNPGHVCWSPRKLAIELSGPRLDASPDSVRPERGGMRDIILLFLLS